MCEGSGAWGLLPVDGGAAAAEGGAVDDLALGFPGDVAVAVEDVHAVGVLVHDGAGEGDGVIETASGACAAEEAGGVEIGGGDGVPGVEGDGLFVGGQKGEGVDLFAVGVHVGGGAAHEGEAGDGDERAAFDAPAVPVVDVVHAGFPVEVEGITDAEVEDVGGEDGGLPFEAADDFLIAEGGIGGAEEVFVVWEVGIDPVGFGFVVGGGAGEDNFGGGPFLVVVGVGHHDGAGLLELDTTADLEGDFTGIAEGRESERDQEGDDGDDDQELYEAECGVGVASGEGWTHGGIFQKRRNAEGTRESALV